MWQEYRVLGRVLQFTVRNKLGITWWPEWDPFGLVTQKQIFSQLLLCNTRLHSSRMLCPYPAPLPGLPSLIFAHELQSIKSAHVVLEVISSVGPFGKGTVKAWGRAIIDRRTMLTFIAGWEGLSVIYDRVLFTERKRYKDSFCVNWEYRNNGVTDLT